jgi:hypothetical protein
VALLAAGFYAEEEGEPSIVVTARREERSVGKVERGRF